MSKLVFARHGLSEWNQKNLFTGWADVDLAEQGVEEAIKAGQLLKEAGIKFDIAFTSVLKRAIKTTNYVLEFAGQLWVPVEKSWRLNERHYGGLTGLNKADAAAKHGDEQVHIWRRSYDTLPPAMPRTDKYSAHTDRRYALLDDSAIPDAENLKVTLERALPYWEDKIAPALKEGKDVFVGAHGNSIRALVKHIEQLSDDEIMNVEIPNFPPLVYDFDDNDSLKKFEKYYLDPNE
ncbi:MAG: phosphoglycerate mutase [Lactobacillales bacterium]|jgi:2,3-bisphosphoglycerate-dependent phosphoglycerate mutase|nr:phosphoglycerate mutase [Lactobacillales bacterium]